MSVDKQMTPFRFGRKAFSIDRQAPHAAFPDCFADRIILCNARNTRIAHLSVQTVAIVIAADRNYRACK